MLKEPLHNLDMAHARGLTELLRDLVDRSGRTIVVVLHEVSYAAAHADRIVAMKDGRVVGMGTPAEILTAERIIDLLGTPVTIGEHEDGRPVVHHVG